MEVSVTGCGYSCPAKGAVCKKAGIETSPQKFLRQRRGKVYGMKIFAVLLKIAAVSILVAGCTSSEKSGGAGDKGDIKVGLYTSMTGSESAWGQASKESVDLATEEFNESGGLNGRKVKIILQDTGSQAEQAKTVAQRLTDTDQVVALLGEIASGRTQQGASVAQAKGIPDITSGSTRDDLAAIGDSFNRVCFNDSMQGKVLGQFVVDKGWKKVALMVDRKQPYSTGLAAQIEKIVTANGGQIVATEFYQGGDPEFSAQLVNIKQKNPDVLIIPGYYTEAAAICKQARQNGLKMQLMGGDGWSNPDLRKQGGPDIVGAMFTDHFTNKDPDPVVQDFVKRYQQKYSKKPEAIGALAYDSAKVLFDAMKRAKSTDGAALKKSVRETKDFPGVTGKITIDDKGNAKKRVLVVRVEDDGSFSVVKVYEPDKL
jgi:branched-chain amino acid transport system substrate-binding protein